MMSLFSSFDFFWFKMLFFLEFLFLYLVFFRFFFFNIFLNFINQIFFFMLKFFVNLNQKSYSKVSVYIFFCLMLFFLVLNFCSNFSFVFCYTSQVSLVFFVSLSVWLSFLIFYIFNNNKSFFSHCVPEGTPMALVSALFFIEIVSNLIRPITLMVRLVANILSGHLLLILLSKIVFTYWPSVLFYIGLNMVEFFVALVQSYIFATMITLYYCELS